MPQFNIVNNVLLNSLFGRKEINIIIIIDLFLGNKLAGLWNNPFERCCHYCGCPLSISAIKAFCSYPFNCEIKFNHRASYNNNIDHINIELIMNYYYLYSGTKIEIFDIGMFIDFEEGNYNDYISNIQMYKLIDFLSEHFANSNTKSYNRSKYIEIFEELRENLQNVLIEKLIL